jgi:hypothetical protein
MNMMADIDDDFEPSSLLSQSFTLRLEAEKLRTGFDFSDCKINELVLQL